jgi:hypothetical protein
VSEWERFEEKFASLVRLGGDERTPENERNNACKLAVAMFTKGDMTVVSTGRWESLMDLYRRMLAQVQVPITRCTSKNIRSRNGWQCCQCGTIQMSLWIWIGFGRLKCAHCGHLRCDEVSQGGDDVP